MASVFHHLLAALCIADLIFLLSLVVVSPVISSCHCLCHNIIKSRSTDIIFLSEHANQPSQSGCPLLICNTPIILRLPWALPATQCWSTTSPSAAATLVWQSVSSSPSQSPSRDIRCKETLHQLHHKLWSTTAPTAVTAPTAPHELEHEIGGKKPE